MKNKRDEKEQDDSTSGVKQARISSILLFILGIGIAFLVYTTEHGSTNFVKSIAPDGTATTTANIIPPSHPFKLGLDLSGGTQLLYKAKTEKVSLADKKDVMMALRDTIERRVNIFGVAEPLVQTQSAGGEDRLIVELPGVTDTQEAIDMLGKTPVLDFRLQQANATTTTFAPTKLTGKYLKRASLQFGNGQGSLANEPVVVLQFNKEGGRIFADLTKENVGQVMGIFLDDVPISTPVIREEIRGGTATVSGSFTPQEAKELVRNLNYGALPIGIELLSANTVGASLGNDAVKSGMIAGILGLAFVMFFLILWYRLQGVVATASLMIYIAIMLAIFKFLPVTLTAAGIAGFIISIGMAVDANVLIFERIKEELAEKGVWTHSAIEKGFKRAWLSIRDGNLSSIITAIILFWFGTSLVKGFALVFGIGVIISMLTAITVTRIFLFALGDYKNEGIIKTLFGSGLRK
jgi:protein-export membrane protein SecD